MLGDFFFFFFFCTGPIIQYGVYRIQFASGQSAGLAEILVLTNWFICSVVFAVKKSGEYICTLAVSQLTLILARLHHFHHSNTAACSPTAITSPLPTYTNTTAPSCDTHADVLGQQKQVYAHAHTHNHDSIFFYNIQK